MWSKIATPEEVVIKKRWVLSWQSPPYLGWLPTIFLVISRATQRQLAQALVLPVNNFSGASPLNTFSFDSSGRGARELSFMGYQCGWGCAVWVRMGAGLWPGDLLFGYSASAAVFLPLQEPTLTVTVLFGTWVWGTREKPQCQSYGRRVGGRG